MEASRGARLRELFDAALEAEAQGRDFYAQMTRIFAHVPAVAEFWKGLVLEEGQHIAALKRIRDGLTEEQLESPVDPTGVRNARASAQVFSEKRIRTIETLDDAYELAHEFENSEINRLFEFFASEYVPNKERREFLKREIHEHQAKLVDFGRRGGGSEWRRTLEAHWVGR